MSTDQAPNTKRITVAHEVPRDPEQYRATVHFGQRLKERAPAEHRDTIVRQCIERGRCRGVSRAQATDRDDVRQCFGFTYEDDLLDATYRLIVGIRPVAFTSEKKHLAVTIVEVEDD